MNFNSRHDNEYKLAQTATNNLIKLYGLQVKYIETSVVHPDFIHGDFNHIKTEGIHDWTVLPEDGTENFNEDIYQEFGLFDTSGLTLYATSDDVDKLQKEQRLHNEDNPRDLSTSTSKLDSTGKSLINDLILLPSGKFLEVTDVEAHVPGLNNRFFDANKKNLYKIEVRSYVPNHNDVQISTSDSTSGLDLNQTQLFELQGTTIDVAFVADVLGLRESDLEGLVFSSKDELVQGLSPFVQLLEQDILITPERALEVQQKAAQDVYEHATKLNRAIDVQNTVDADLSDLFDIQDKTSHYDITTVQTIDSINMRSETMYPLPHRPERDRPQPESESPDTSNGEDSSSFFDKYI